jgi:hypothetical protein
VLLQLAASNVHKTAHSYLDLLRTRRVFYFIYNDMFGIGGQQVPTPPPTVPTDKILPLNAADDTTVLRSVVVVLSYRFDDVLDPGKLKSSYEKLLDRPGWRKIGARLRLNVSALGLLRIEVEPANSVR